MKVLLVYPLYPVTYMGFHYAAPLTGTKAVLPPLGLLTVAAMLPRAWEHAQNIMRMPELNRRYTRLLITEVLRRRRMPSARAART